MNLILELEQRLDPHFWWVNQGDTYALERQYGCVFASRRHDGGTEYTHHTNIMHLKLGDMTFHYANGQIVAISCVAGLPVDGIRPYEKPPHYVRKPGYYSPTEYCELSTGIALDAIPLDWRVGIGPFVSRGLPKQHYLNPLPQEFVRRFVARFRAVLAPVSS